MGNVSCNWPSNGGYVCAIGNNKNLKIHIWVNKAPLVSFLLHFPSNETSKQEKTVVPYLVKNFKVNYWKLLLDNVSRFLLARQCTTHCSGQWFPTWGQGTIWKLSSNYTEICMCSLLHIHKEQFENRVQIILDFVWVLPCIYIINGKYRVYLKIGRHWWGTWLLLHIGRGSQDRKSCELLV